MLIIEVTALKILDATSRPGIKSNQRATTAKEAIVMSNELLIMVIIVTALASSLCALILGLVVFQRWLRPRLEARLEAFAEWRKSANVAARNAVCAAAGLPAGCLP